MTLLLIFLSAACFAVWFARRPDPVIRNAVRVRVHRPLWHGMRFYVEEAQYADYHKAIHFYFDLVPLIQQRPHLVATEYSFLDWCDSTFVFSGYRLKLLRVVDKIYLIQSSQPMDATTFEQGVAEMVRAFER